MFRSFFLAGFEGSTGYNRHGQWFDQVVATGHEKTFREDYRALAKLGIHGIREVMRWPLIDLGHGRYDFSSVAPFMLAAAENGIEVIWDLFHYGFPRHVDVWSREFPSLFADYCYAAARFADRHSEGALYVTPVNEPSFMAYAAGEKGLFAPHETGRGWDLKVALVRAAIQGIDAIRSVRPDARIVNADPLCRAAVPEEQPDCRDEVEDFNNRLVFQSWDMLCGRLLPELGGSRAHLDIVGINYYWTNQWEWGLEPSPDGTIPPLSDHDPRRVKLGDLVTNVWDRYGGDLIITETTHVGEKRGPWLREVAEESELLLRDGVPLQGVCIYPILGMPEWHSPQDWTAMGLWDPVCHQEPHGARVPCQPMLDVFRDLRVKALISAAN
ncbi:glycoside hydrolase family 1 protein [Microvirga alba]|uniref:Glycoside hydrolase n=1 Tax=Microvirga alba TaxID=2791025 RepID=A0A931BP88_9HYPH|nr:glycoside hydrolase [Microvirga alba]MBF9232800.1 glycoside hydrolase [Microvirga alba]